MPDEIIASTTPVIAPVDTPTPVVTPVVEAIVAPTSEPVKSPEATTVKTPDPAPVTLIADALDKPVVAPVAPVTDTAPETQSAETAPVPVVDTVVPDPVQPKYDQFALPEGITLDNERVGKFTELLSDLELSGKASHDVVQQFGQKAVDFYLEEVKQYGENLTKYYQTTWDKQKTAWKEATLSDPEIGGNRIQTTLDSVLGFIRTHGGTAEQQKEFRNVMETSGLGNHPAVIRLFANAAVAYKEGKPLAAPKPIQETKSKTETMYGKRSA